MISSPKGRDSICCWRQKEPSSSGDRPSHTILPSLLCPGNRELTKEQCMLC